MRKQKGSPYGEAGQTLLEILLAFGVSVMVLSAVIMGVIISLNNAQYAKNQGLANSYAQEGMAVVRKTRDSGWTDFNLKNGNYCLAGSSTELPPSTSPSCGQNVGIFSRAVKIEPNISDCRGGGLNGNKVTVIVSWADSKCPLGTSLCHKVELITCLSNID